MEQALKDPSVTEQQLKDKMAAIIDMPFQSHALREDYKEDLSRLIHTAFEGKANPAAAAQIFAHDFNVRMADLQSKSPLPALIETAANNFRDYKIDPSLASFKMPDGNINNVSAAYFDHNQGSSPNQKSLVFKADGAINGSVALVEKETNIFTVREITPTLQKLLNGAGFKEPPASISLETATVHADNRRIINHLLEMANDNVKFDSEIKAKAEQLGVKPDDVVQALDTYKLLKTNLSSSELNHGLPGGATDETGRHYVDNALTAPNLTTVAALQQADRDAQQLLEQARKQAAAPRPAAPAQTTAYDLRFEQRMKGQGDLYVTSGGVSGRPAPQIIQNANGKPIAAVYRNGAPGYEDCPPQGRPAIKHGFNQRVEALKHNTTWGVFAFSGHGVHKPKCPPCPEECYSGHDPRTGKPVEPVRKSPSVIQAAAPPSAKPGCAPDHDCVIRVDPQTLNNTAGVVITSQVPQTNDATGQPCNKNDNNPCVVFVDNARDMTTPKGVTMIPTQTTPTFAVRPN